MKMFQPIYIPHPNNTDLRWKVKGIFLNSYTHDLTCGVDDTLPDYIRKLAYQTANTR